MGFTSTVLISPLFVLCGTLSDGQESPWAHVCRDRYCYKVDQAELQPGEIGLAVGVCKLNCANDGNLWPLPTGVFNLGNSTTAFYPQNVRFDVTGAPAVFHSWLENLRTLFVNNSLVRMHPDNEGDDSNHFTPEAPADNNILNVEFRITSNSAQLGVDTNEAYSLTLTANQTANSVTAVITAETYFGARHGLETLSQLVAYDDYNKTGRLQVLDSATVNDRPVFSYRGVMLDTTRNFMPVDRMKKIIDGLSYSKLNILHWHITDTHSYPMETTGQPEMTKYGAYSPKKVYSIDNMKDLVEYSKIRGVKIVAEFDAPAHVGNGWQWGPSQGLGNLAVCVNQEPWYRYCVEPPCGQLNLANPNMYNVLDKVYETMLSVFDNDIFHMGGDEVHFGCYNTTDEITNWMETRNLSRTEEGFVEVWDEFQTRAREGVLKASTIPDTKVILWTSTITEQKYVEQYIDKDNYIIQLWSTGSDAIIPFLLDKGYRTIFSNYDALYLDCGYQAWIGNGHNWCSPYKGWQTIYDNSPFKIYASTAGETVAQAAIDNKQILGAIAPMWAEQVDGQTLEGKIFPRAAALAERLWTNPKTTTWLEAERRMVNNRQRLVERGIQADRLQPEWCYQNENQCPGWGAAEPEPEVTSELPLSTTLDPVVTSELPLQTTSDPLVTSESPGSTTTNSVCGGPFSSILLYTLTVLCSLALCNHS